MATTATRLWRVQRKPRASATDSQQFGSDGKGPVQLDRAFPVAVSGCPVPMWQP